MGISENRKSPGPALVEGSVGFDRLLGGWLRRAESALRSAENSLKNAISVNQQAPNTFEPLDIDRLNLRVDIARMQLERGLRIQEILKQPQYRSVPIEKQVMSIFAVTNGYMDEVPMDKVRAWEDAYLSFMDRSHSDVGAPIVSEKQISDDMMVICPYAARPTPTATAPAICTRARPANVA